MTHLILVGRRSPRQVRRAAAVLLLALAALALVWIGRASADASSPTARHATKDFFAASNVPIPKADAAVSTFFSECSCSPTMHAMSGMSKTFRLGGRVPQRVIVMFQGEFFQPVERGAHALVRLVIDGVPQNSGEEVVIASHVVQATHGFQWVSESLAPGTHTAVIEWRDGGDAPVYVAPRSMIILHK
jgi:hypothetical protein